MCHVAESIPDLDRGSRRFRFGVISLLMAFGLIAGSVPSLAQVFTATLTGVVSDPSSGAVPKATINLTNSATNERRTTLSGADGRYTFSQLLPGTYELSAEAAGFKKFVQQG